MPLLNLLGSRRKLYVSRGIDHDFAYFALIKFPDRIRI